MKKIKTNLIAFLGMLLYAITSWAQPSGMEVARMTDKRDDGEFVTQTLKMQLIDRRGKQRERITKTFRKYYGKERRQAIFYLEPSNIKGTAFLVYDYPEKGKDNDQWLYLPALRKTRRISAANRGDYFLGTDMTYEDISLGSKLSLEDYDYKYLKSEMVDGHESYVIEGIPVDDKTAKELGYSKVQAWVDIENAMIRKAEYWDIAGNNLKTIQVTDIRKVDGIWTGHKFEIVNHKTGHKTIFTFNDVDYNSTVPDDVFTEDALVIGI